MQALQEQHIPVHRAPIDHARHCLPSWQLWWSVWCHFSLIILVCNPITFKKIKKIKLYPKIHQLLYVFLSKASKTPATESTFMRVALRPLVEELRSVCFHCFIYYCLFLFEKLYAQCHLSFCQKTDEDIIVSTALSKLSPTHGPRTSRLVPGRER